MKRLLQFAGISFLGLTLVFTAGALAQGGLGDTLDQPFSGAFWTLVAGAIADRRWGAVIGLAMAVVIYLARYIASRNNPAFTTSVAARIMTTGLAVLVVLLPALLAGQGLSFGLLGTVISMIFTAFGAWNGVLKPIVPSPTLPPSSDVGAASKLGGLLK